MAYPHVEIVRDAIAANLKSGKVGGVDLLPRVDFDGDPVLEIRVCIVSDMKKLDGFELASLTGVVREAMFDVQDFSFPILRFMDKKDWTSLHEQLVKNEAA
jgi:hypothetical protein